MVVIFPGVLIYATLYAIMGKSAAPGGQLFSLVTLTIAANFGGWLMGLTTLPRLIGMLLTGILMQNIGAVNIDGIADVTAHLRKFALVLILTRAGLEMDPEAFKKVWPTIIKLSLIPWTAELAVNAVICHFLFDMPLLWCLLLGTINNIYTAIKFYALLKCYLIAFISFCSKLLFQIFFN